MPLEKKPATLAPKSRVPPDFRPYKVQNGDSWNKIARLHGMEVWELIYENFKTRDPDEVNWYLRHYVGCKKPTKDGKNWMFSASADPGIIYLPITRIVMPPMYIEGKVPSKLKNVWAGIGKSHSGDLFIFHAQG